MQARLHRGLSNKDPSPVCGVKALELALVILQCLVAPEACFDGSKVRQTSSGPTQMI